MVTFSVLGLIHQYINITGTKCLFYFFTKWDKNHGCISFDNQVLAAGTHLQMSEVVQLCCQFMELAITSDNCVDILNLTELYVLGESKNKARTYLLNHFESFAESPQYFKLNHTQLASLLDENKLKVILLSYSDFITPVVW